MSSIKIYVMKICTVIDNSRNKVLWSSSRAPQAGFSQPQRCGHLGQAMFAAGLSRALEETGQHP